MYMKFLLFFLAIANGFQFVSACTGVLRKAEDGAHVYARTMEFGKDFITFELTFAPRKVGFTADNGSGGKGLMWTNQYAYVGFSPFGLPKLADGLNEKGLACGGFYIPGWVGYQTATADESSRTISNLDFVNWVLGNFSSVQQAVDALPGIIVTGAVIPQLNGVPPLHYMIADATGDHAVVEYVDGKLHVYRDPLNVITNAPTYDWHAANARNYIGLRALNKPAVEVNGKDLAAFSQGSGALGLPGDFTSPSRFIRAGFLRAVALQGKDGQDEVFNTFKILNQFDIPKGAVREEVDGKTLYEETQWTAAADLHARKYYFHTALSRNIRAVDLSKIDLDGKEIKTIKVDTPQTVDEIADKFK